MSTRERVHQMVDRLSESDLLAVRRMLDGLLAVDPLQALLDEAPEDDEPETDEDRQAVAEGLAAYARGEGMPLDNLTEDEETARLVASPRFRSIIERSRAHYRAEGGISSDEMRKRLDVNDPSSEG